MCLIDYHSNSILNIIADDSKSNGTHSNTTNITTIITAIITAITAVSFFLLSLSLLLLFCRARQKRNIRLPFCILYYAPVLLLLLGYLQQLWLEESHVRYVS